LIPQWIKDIPPFVSAVIAAVGALIAVVSATVSAGSLYLNWRNYRRDRPDVRVELKWNAEKTITFGKDDPIECLAHIRVTNQGRRPAHIDFIGLELPGRKRVVNWLDESVKLAEGDPSIIIKIHQDSTLAPFADQWKNIFASASDNTGRAYRSENGGDRPIIVPGFNKETARRLQEINPT
jgi:hypothetical protein